MWVSLAVARVGFSASGGGWLAEPTLTPEGSTRERRLAGAMELEPD